jgi:hypothetical protein
MSGIGETDNVREYGLEYGLASVTHGSLQRLSANCMTPHDSARTLNPKVEGSNPSRI